MTNDMILTNLAICICSYICYFLLNTIFNTITADSVYTTNVCKLLSLDCLTMKEMMNIVLFDTTSN